MSIPESIDSVPAFKKALKELEDQYSGQANLEAILEEVIAFSNSLNRRADLEQLRAAIKNLDGLLAALQKLSVDGGTFETSVFSPEHFGNDSLAAYFDELFTKLSASLPNIFVSDGEERALAVQATRAQLEEIGRFADLQGNSHVVSLSEAMVAVVDYHKESLIAKKGGAESAQLVKPLLRGFALLRTAFDSPEEPNLSPALIDSTANLRDLIGSGNDADGAGENLGFENGPILSSVLTDETVVELDETKQTLNRKPVEPLTRQSEKTTIDTRQTMAFGALQPVLMRKTPIKPTKDVNVLLLGLEAKTSWLLPFAEVLPLKLEHLSTPEKVQEKVLAETLDLIICCADLDGEFLDTVVDAIKDRKKSQPVQLILAKVQEDQSVRLYLQSHDDQLAAFRLQLLEKDEFPELIQRLQEGK